MRTVITALVLAVVVGLGFQWLPTESTQAAYPSLSKLYLPVVYRQMPLVPTPTPVTPTPTPNICPTSVQALVNPSFENNWAPWDTIGLAHRTNTLASNGSWSAVVGGYNNSEDGIAQSVMVPSWVETAAIYFDWRMISNDSTVSRYDALGVAVYEAGTVNRLALTFVWNNDVRGSWRTNKLAIPNIANHRNQGVDVIIAGLNDFSLPTMWYVDNMKLNFACGNIIAGTELVEPGQDGNSEMTQKLLQLRKRMSKRGL